MKRHIPNIITIGNLLCGCLAISSAFEGKLYISSYWLIVASVLDFLDGFAARLLKVSNPLGKQLDSLADMIAFGLAPGILLYQYTKELNQINEIRFLTENPWIFYLAFSIPVFSALRLAKFNVDTRQTSSFIGLPTPANASFFLFPVIIYSFPDLPKVIDLNFLIMPFISNPLIMLGFGIIFSILLVAEVPMFSLKFKNFKWKDNKLPFTFIISWFLMFVFSGFIAMPTIVVAYVLWSLISHYILANNNTP